MLLKKRKNDEDKRVTRKREKIIWRKKLSMKKVEHAKLSLGKSKRKKQNTEEEN